LRDAKGKSRAREMILKKHDGIENLNESGVYFPKIHNTDWNVAENISYYSLVGRTSE